ncbi:MAG TPA: hypothetical protein IGS17_16125 [Oscillatoriales cyanobacterium M59_W2019_021]|nr:MAG: hypothetical protein D6728_05375 [Cyanobacteria bacterium J055]HIK30855.1 hypothetical protein [Oscillatoriales cyanobacterium M4454_W2019_049]HIK52434.1 hypothetical protein [Oscillatoriales cyanobacterium M59_W2019_021]
MSSPSSIDPWKYKPWWCQPWSIVLTGMSLTIGSWLLFHRVWLTVLVAIPVLVWMVFFLVFWPPMMAQYLAQLQAEEDDR